MKAILPILALPFLAIQSYGMINLLVDDFNDGSIDPAKWDTVEPFTDSHLREENGYLEVEDSGRITTVNEFTEPYQVSGSIQLSNNAKNNSKIVLRTDGAQYFSEVQGVALQIGVLKDSGAAQGQLALFTIGASGEDQAISEVNYTLALDTWYDFSIVDDGSKIDVFFDGAMTPTITLATAWAGVGDKISFYNREGSGNGSSISNDGLGRLDSFTVSTVPEPSTYAAILGLLSLGIVNLQRKRYRG